MAELFKSGHIIDFVLMMVVVQGLILGGLYKRGIWRAHPANYIISVLPGACLLLALRAALTDAHWSWVAACMALGLVTHWVDLARQQIGPSDRQA